MLRITKTLVVGNSVFREDWKNEGTPKYYTYGACEVVAKKVGDIVRCNEIANINNVNSVCWDCARCNESCQWVRRGIPPDGSIVMVKNNRERTQKIVRCPNFEKEEQGAASWQNRDDMEPYLALRDCIIKDVIKDYVNSLFIMKLYAEDKGSLRLSEASRKKYQCERFFSSEYFASLMDTNGKRLAKELRKKVAEVWEYALNAVTDTGKVPKGLPQILWKNKRLVKAAAAARERCKEL